MSSNMINPCALWMGDLDPYMNEQFISNAFSEVGENVFSVKIIRAKHSGAPAGYCFVEFLDPDLAHRAKLRLNGKVVPGTNPPKRFKLNMASFGREHLSVPEYSLFVGELSEDVDDMQLYEAFSKKYKTCRAAKVVLEKSGKSRGYGFVRFSDEDDQRRALHEMYHHEGIGKNFIRVALATPKTGKRSGPPGVGYPGSHQSYSQYSQYYNNTWWQAYQQPGQYAPYQKTPMMHDQPTQDQENYDTSVQHFDEEEELEDPGLDVDVEKLNKEFMEASEELYLALEGSRWHPIDNVMSPISIT